MLNVPTCRKPRFEDLKRVSLPKWPQLIITGEPVPEKWTKDIIFRTDTFFDSISRYAGGNNHGWNEWAHEQLGYDLLFKLESELGTTKYYEAVDKLRRELGFVQTNYITNSWASCAYVYGPHGWCSPKGEICHVDNVGKWPSAEMIYNDLLMLAAAFPYLNLTATVMSGEMGEALKEPLITFVVRAGEVLITDDHQAHHFNVTMPERDAAAMLLSMSREQGLPDRWITEFGEKTKPVVKALVSKLKKELAK